MAEENPYAAPEVSLSLEEEWHGGVKLANRGTRLVAALLDGIIGMIFGFPLLYAFGIWNYVAQGQQPPLGLMIGSSAAGFVVFLAIHGYFLYRNGQTVGKKLLGIRIADLSGKVPDFGRVILLRYLPISLVTLIPVAGSYLPLIDALFIFRADRRCIHDLIAGTMVVVAKKAAR
jgi:uncharacterized RDD family membrane protein YckC